MERGEFEPIWILTGATVQRVETPGTCRDAG